MCIDFSVLGETVDIILNRTFFTIPHFIDSLHSERGANQRTKQNKREKNKGEIHLSHHIVVAFTLSLLPFSNCFLLFSLSPLRSLSLSYFYLFSSSSGSFFLLFCLSCTHHIFVGVISLLLSHHFPPNDQIHQKRKRQRRHNKAVKMLSLVCACCHFLFGDFFFISPFFSACARFAKKLYYILFSQTTLFVCFHFILLVWRHSFMYSFRLPIPLCGGGCALENSIYFRYAQTHTRFHLTMPLGRRKAYGI